MNDYDLYTLPNGIRVVHKQITHTKIIHCGFVLDIGSRDEQPHQQGIAHFWEHMAFKGTTRRKAFHILNRLDSVGGELDAYTTKEKICFYASALDRHLEKAVELLSDITFDAVFPEKQIELERNVILEEMAMYRDAPEDAIQDEFDELVFNGHPMGYNILGTTESVQGFNRNDFKQFIAENLDTSRVVFTCVSRFPFSKVLKLAQKYLADVPATSRPRQRQPFTCFTPTQKTVHRALTQSQCAPGRPAYPLAHKNRLPFFMLVNLLGGSSHNTRLNLALRERHGYVYTVEAGYSAFSDTGLFAIYFGTEPAKLHRSLEVLRRELKKMQTTPLGAMQLHSAKEQLMGQIAMAEENNTSLMLMMGKSLIDQGHIDSLAHVFDGVRAITASTLQGLAQEMFNQDALSQLVYLPENE